MPDETQPLIEAPKRRWVGVLLSLCVPGFGLVRAGLIRRAVLWFIAVQVIGLLAALLAIWRSIPFGAVLAGLAIALGCQVAMWVDSFRPGKLSARLWLVFVALFLAMLFLPSTLQLFADAFTVSSEAMAPTLLGKSHGTADHVICDRLSYLISAPKRGDLIVFRTTGIAEIHNDTFFVQRLAGLPGEKIEIRDEHIFANGRQLGESDGIPSISYTTGPAGPFVTEEGVYAVPQNAYFMLGDNSPHSFDSRFWGYLPKANIYGRVARIYYPFSRLQVPR